MNSSDSSLFGLFGLIMSDKVFSINANRWIAPPGASNVALCGTKRCLCCKSLDSDNCYKSFSTGHKFVFDKTGIFTCKTKFVIYLITCMKCGIQYVGQTRQELHCRLNGHRHSIDKDKLSTYLCQHFNSAGHSFSDISLQIIDCVDSTQMSAEEAKRELDLKEDFYIKTLNTVYPLGLNDKLLGQGRVSNDTADAAPFYLSPISRRRRSHGKRRRKKCNKIDLTLLFDQLQNYFDTFNFCEFYRILCSLRRSTLRILFQNLSCVSSSMYLSLIHI